MTRRRAHSKSNPELFIYLLLLPLLQTCPQKKKLKSTSPTPGETQWGREAINGGNTVFRQVLQSRVGTYTKFSERRSEVHLGNLEFGREIPATWTLTASQNYTPVVEEKVGKKVRIEAPHASPARKVSVVAFLVGSSPSTLTRPRDSPHTLSSGGGGAARSVTSHGGGQSQGSLTSEPAVFRSKTFFF